MENNIKMVNKKRNAIFACIGFATLTLSICAISLSDKLIYNNYKADNQYKLVLTSSTSLTNDGSGHEASVRTTNGNDILFGYSNISKTKDSFQTINSHGYIYNIDSISGIKNVVFDFESTEPLLLAYGWKNKETIEYFKTDIELNHSLTYGFDGYQPNFFKIYNTSSTSITINSLEINYTCIESKNPSLKYENVVNETFNGPVGEQAFNNKVEGQGFVIQDDGTASTITNVGSEGAAPQWTFNSNGYDHNVPSFEINATFKAVSNGVSETQSTQTAVLRFSYDWGFDVQFNISHNNGWNGIKVYKIGGQELASSDTLSFSEDRYYIFTVRLINNGSQSQLQILVDGNIVIDVSNFENLSPFACQQIGSSQGSYIKWDNFKLDRIIK